MNIARHHANLEQRNADESKMMKSELTTPSGFLSTMSLPEGKARDISLDLQQAILLHKLAPGTKLSEDEVGEFYGVSRSIARIALQALAHSELITIQKNRGAFVAQPSQKEARDVFDARARIEPIVAALAAENITSQEIEQLEVHMRNENEAVHKGELKEALYLSGLFHVHIAEASKQQVLTAIVRSLVARSSLIISLYWVRPETNCETHSHSALLKAFKTRDKQAAEEIMQSHMVDLFSGLNLREKEETTKPLADLLT